MSSLPSSATPRDAQILTSLLADMGVVDYEPRVISQLLEFAFRYTSDILNDARIYSEHAGKKIIDGDDVRLAINAFVDSSFTSPPPRQLVLELAREKNSIALPPLKQSYGARLPNDRFCLLQPDYRLKKRAELRAISQVATNREQLAGPSHVVSKIAREQPQMVFRLVGQQQQQQQQQQQSPSNEGVKKVEEPEEMDEDYDRE